MMKKVIFLLVMLIILFCSCSNLKIATHKNIDGCYYAKVKKYGFTTLYILIINEDNTFSFNIKIQGGNPKCDGKWKIIDKKFLVLECEEATMLETLTNAYMNQRLHVVHIVNKNKLKYDNIVLKRQNNK